ncbi:hypothetical protein ABFV44_20535, partial [Pseudomonas poae]
MPAQPKVTKRLLPHHSAPRWGSVCPHAGLVDGAPEIKIKSQSKADQKHDLSPIRFSVGAGLPAMQTPQSIRKTQSM